MSPRTSPPEPPGSTSAARSRPGAGLRAALFGWQFDVGPAEYGRYATAYLDGSRVAALAPNQDSEATQFWWNVYLATADCDATAAAVERAGGSVVDPPADVMDQGRMAIVRDPAGGQFGLLAGPSTSARAGQRAQHLVRNDLDHRPARVTRRFYAEVFGFLGRQPGSAGFDFTFTPSRRARDRWDRGRAERAKTAGPQPSRSTTPTPR